AGRMSAALSPVADAMVPLFSEKISQGYPVLLRAAREKQKNKLLEQVEKLREQGKLTEAEKLLVPVYDKLEALAIWYPSPSQRGETVSPLESALADLDAQLVSRSRQHALAAINVERRKRLPDF